MTVQNIDRETHPVKPICTSPDSYVLKANYLKAKISDNRALSCERMQDCTRITRKTLQDPRYVLETQRVHRCNATNHHPSRNTRKIAAPNKAKRHAMRSSSSQSLVLSWTPYLLVFCQKTCYCKGPTSSTRGGYCTHRYRVVDRCETLAVLRHGTERCAQKAWG